MRGALRWSMAGVLTVGLVGVTALAQPRPGQGGGFGGGGPSTLIRSKLVRDDLKLTDEQGEKLVAWGKEFFPKQDEKRKELMKDVPRDKFFEKIGEVSAELNKEFYKEVGTILTADQVKRLKQLDVQVAGTRALTRADVAEALKLTADQKDKIKGIGEEAGKERQALGEKFGAKGFFPPKLEGDKQKEYDEAREALTKATESKLQGVLTDEQKATWKDLTGPAFDVAKYRAEQPAFRPGGNTPGRPKKDDKKDN